MKWLTRKEVVAKVHLCYVTIWRMLKADEFPRGYNVRGKILWAESDIDDWVRSQQRQTLKGDTDPLPTGRPRGSTKLKAA